MKFTDIFIRRPVLASVVSLVILVVGLRSFSSLQVLAYPKTENGVVTISTSFPGADPDAIAGFITTPMETAIAQANGIDYMQSTSQSSTSTITVYLRQNYDTSKAAAEINIKVKSVLNQLPTGTLQPVITVKVGQTIDAMYMGFTSDVLASNQITDYLTRVVQPKLQALEGVQTAEILGGQTFSLRAWLDPAKLQAYGMTASDVSNALANNDYMSAVGNTKGQMIQITLTSTTNLHSLEEFRNLVVKSVNGANVYLKDVAKVSLGADSYEARVAVNGITAVFIGMQIAPTANLLSVIKGVRDAFPEIVAQLPQGLKARVMYDSTDFVNASIHEVAVTLIEALVIVMLVIFAFLGSPRSVLIPVVAIPLSLVGTLGIMLALGFSINLLTLLALVLAIGLVVDDAIIVVENVNRHLEDGMAPLAAAMQAARELGTAILAMTVVLLAVYIPIGFQGGLTGALFTEFVFTLAGAVTVSAVIALTLSPMMCSRLLKPHRPEDRNWETRVVEFIDVALRSAAPLVSAQTRAEPALHAGHRHLRRARSGEHCAPVSQRQERAGAAGGPGLRRRATHLRAGCHAAAKSPLRRRGIQDLQERAGHAKRSSRSTPRVNPSTAWCWVRYLNAAARPRSSSPCSKNWDPSRVRRSRCFNFPRCPALRACRCNSPSRPPKPALRLNEVSSEFLAAGAEERHVHVHRHGPEVRPAAVGDRNRPRQGGAARPHHESGRLLARKPAGRRLRQLLQHADALLQGDSAGRAGLEA